MTSVSSSPSNVLKMRVRLDLQKKIEVINYLASGKKQIEAAKRFSIPRGTVSTIVKDKDKLLIVEG